ncbi:MAG: hypothetical protein NVSMB64_13580 [Candidatus Velthaea sp.]
MAPNQASQLQRLLAGNSAPANPKTPDDRTDPHHEYLISLQRIRATLNDAIDGHEATDPAAKAILVASRFAIEKLLAGIDGSATAMLMAAQLAKPVAPQIASQLEMQAMQSFSPPSAPAMAQPAPAIGGSLPQQPMGATAGPPSGEPVSPGAQPG